MRLLEVVINLTFLVFKKCESRKSRLGLIPEKTDSERHPLQDEDHSGNDPHLFHGFLHLNCGMSLERVRNEPELLGSEEIHLS